MSSRVLHRLYKPIPSGKTEDPDEYKWDGLHPIRIGDRIKQGRYRIVHKLRHGSFSTVWLARDTHVNVYVALKIVEAETSSPDNNELKVLQTLTRSSLEHPGRDYVLTLIDDFWIEGPNGRHLCYVTQVAGSRLFRPEGADYENLNLSQRIAYQLCQGVAYLHACNVAHGDLYPSNILFQLAAFDSWSEDDIYSCVGHPVTEVVQRRDGGQIDETVPQYLVQPCNMQSLEARLQMPKILMIDFGQAFYLDDTPEVLTPKQFSAPELLFGGEAISAATDQWQLGCTIFEVCSGYSLLGMLFNPKMDVMKDMVAMLGKPPNTMWRRWDERKNYFEDDGMPKAAVGRKIPVRPYPLVDRVMDIMLFDERAKHERVRPVDEEVKETGTERLKPSRSQLDQLCDLLRKLLIYEPAKRLSIEQALTHPFFKELANNSMMREIPNKYPFKGRPEARSNARI